VASRLGIPQQHSGQFRRVLHTPRLHSCKAVLLWLDNNHSERNLKPVALPEKPAAGFFLSRAIPGMPLATWEAVARGAGGNAAPDWCRRLALLHPGCL
jgi:hypothetical protein